MKIILFGAPGVGKGTQAKELAKKYQIPHISTGDILRQAISKENELGKKVKSIVESGELVPDSLMKDLVEDVLTGNSCKNGFIIDGYPRTVQQAEILDEVLEKLNDGKDPVVINLKAEHDVIIKRLSQRRACKVCGGIFNLDNIEDENVCPSCGARNSLYKREDDEESVIKNRLEVFEKNTKPVIDYYEGKKKIITVDATKHVEEVTGEILDKLENA